MAWKNLNITGTFTGSLDSIGYGIYEFFCGTSESDRASFPIHVSVSSAGPTVYVPLIKFPNLKITLVYISSAISILLFDENTKTSSVIYSFTTRDCTQISTLYSHNILYYESDEYFILGGLCISKDYIFSTTIANIGTSNTSYARGHSFIYDIKREYNILPLNISNIGISSTGSIYAYPVISTDDYIYNNILNICTPLDIYPGIYLMNGKKYFMTSEISYRVKNTANTKYCWAILLDKMK